MGTKDKDNIISFLDTLTDALGESEELSREDIIVDLKEEGIDVDAEVKRICEMVQYASQEAKRKQLEIARKKRLQMEANKPARLGEFVNWTKDQIIEKIYELIPSSEPLAIVSYRELESKSKDDLAALLEDLITAKEMEEKESTNES